MGPVREPVAVVGSSCRFPGGADCPQKLWDLLLKPKNIVKRIPSDRFSADGFQNQDGSHHGTSNSVHSYFLDEDPRLFDANFFGINPREAEAIDPQHRLLLETVYEALETAGLSLETMRGTATGVYVGLMCADYFDVQMRDPESLLQYHSTGTARSILSNRISYFFDWKGPSWTVDTACSSSLVAVHQAVQALRDGECTSAIAAGANLIFGPEMYIAESKLRMLSPTGHSRMWDSSADGYSRGEGMGVAVLKLLRDAIRDGDQIECVIRETGVNSDGRTGGITMPSATSQAALIRQTYSRAGLDPSVASERCQYFEAHGTGTPAGDPIEAEAIQSVFFPENRETTEDVLFVGSIKTVVGHTEGTAGIAGLLKASLALQNRVVPPNLHFNRLNPNIAPFYDNLEIPTEPKSFPNISEGQVLRASVNSFGFGGTNSHCILERYEPSVHGKPYLELAPQVDQRTLEGTVCEGDEFTMLPFSACSEGSLSQLIDSYHSYLDVNSGVDLKALSVTLQQNRTAFPLRTCIGGFSREHILEQMRDKSTKVSDAGRTGNNILGVFTGQGAQWPSMGRELIKSSEIFSSTIDRLEQTLSRVADAPSWSLRQELLADKEDSRCNQSSFSQPLCTAIQIAMVDLLHSVGVNFSVVVGHSSGEISAAYASGRLTADAAIILAYYRGLHSKLTEVQSGRQLSMMAVGVDFVEAKKICSRPQYADRIFVAASNAPSSCTLAGDASVLKEALEEFNGANIFARMLFVDKAYHSPYMNPCSQPYLDSLEMCGIKYSASQPSCTWVSSVHGFEMDTSSDQVDNQYWVDNLLHTVLFSDAIQQAVTDHGPFDFALEVGPHSALQGPTLQTLKALKQQPIPYYSALRRGENDVVALGNCMGSLWTIMGPSAVSLSRVQTAINRGASNGSPLLKDLPKYAWDHETIYWRESRASNEYRNRSAPHELLGTCIEKSEQEIRWRNILRPQEISWLKGHKFQNEMLFPAAGYCVMAVEAARNFWSRSVQFIELQDLDIRRGINFEDGSPGVEMIFSLNGISYASKAGNEDLNFAVASFSCSAGKVDGSDSLSTRFTGKLRVQFGEPNVSLLPSKGQELPETSDVDLNRFYSSMLNIGLDYSGEFRGLLSAERRHFQTSALASKTPSSSSVHPGFLDTCFQALFLSFAAPGDESLRTAFLPKSIKSLRLSSELWQGPSKQSSSLRLDAYITDFQPPSHSVRSYFSGDIDIFDDYNNGLIQVEGLSCVAFANAPKEDDRRFFFSTVWESDISCGMIACDNQEPEDDQTVIIRQECEALAYQYIQVAEDSMPRTENSSLFPSYMALEPQAKTILDDENKLAPTVKAPAEFTDLKFTNTVGESLISFANGSNHQEFDQKMAAIMEEYLEFGLGLSRIRKFTARTVKQIAHRYPRMKILETGGNNGTTAELVLDSLDGAFASYSFSDPSSEAVKVAENRLINQAPRLQFITLDVHDFDQGELADHSFDLIIAFKISCNPTEAISSLKNIRKLLKPGGYLLLIGPTGRTGFSNLVRMNLHRLFQQFDGLSSSIVQSDEDWGSNLEKCGFSGIDSIVYDSQDSSQHCFSLILSQAQDSSFDIIRQPLKASNDINLADRILIIGGGSPIGSSLLGELLNHLEHWKDRITVTTSLDTLVNDDVAIPKFILNLAELDDPIMRDMTPSKFKTLQTLFQQTQNVFWITQQSEGDNVYGSMTIGLGRVVATESPNLNITFLGIDKSDPLDSNRLAGLFTQFVNGVQSRLKSDEILWHREPEMALKGSRLLIPRVLPIKNMNDRFNSRYRPITSELKYNTNSLPEETKTSQISSELGNAALTSVNIIACSSMAICINRETHLYLAIAEIEGSPQKTVLCFSPSKGPSVRLPAAWLLECDFVERPTAQTLETLVRLQIASTIQKSTHYGTIMVFTNDEWLARVILLNAKNEKVTMKILTSNPSVSKAGNAVALTHPYSSRRAIRSLLPRNISLFVDLSLESTSLQSHIIDSLPEACARQNFNTHLRSKPSSALGSEEVPFQSILGTLFNAFLSSDCYGPVPEPRKLEKTSLFSIEEYSKDTVLHSIVERVNPETLFRSDVTYFLVGLTGELGQSLCKWMVDNGARYLVIASRSARGARWHQELESDGCRIMTQSLDIRDKKALNEVYSNIVEFMPPVAGVVNGAMVLSDSAFFNMTYESFMLSLGPKAEGSANLDELFSSNDLDFFIMLSSTASLIGNAGQANYSVANMFMKGLAERRHNRGLAGSCVDLGMVIGVGVVSREGVYEEPLRKIGLMAVAETDFHCIFAEAILTGRANSSVEPCFSTGLHVPPGKTTPAWYNNPRFAHFQVIESNNLRSGQGKAIVSIREKLQAIEDQSAGESVVQEAFIAKLTGLLQLPAPVSNPNRPLVELGIDSLLALEIRTWFLNELNFTVSVLKILGGSSLVSLCREATEFSFRTRATESPEDSETLIESSGEEPATPNTDTSLPSVIGASPPSSVSSEEPSKVYSDTNSEIGLDVERTEKMSVEQEQLWFLLECVDDPAMYNCTIQYEMHGPVEATRLKNAMVLAAQRHESLRTAFYTDPLDGVAKQAILEKPNIAWTHLNIGKEFDVKAEFLKLHAWPFDVAQGQTMAVTLMSRGPNEHIVIFGYHHIIMDGVSWQLLLREYAAAYKNMDALPPITAQYATFSRKQRSALIASQNRNDKIFWEKQFLHAPEPLPLFPFAKTSFRQSRTKYDMSRRNYKLSEGISSGVKAASSNLGATGFHFYLAAIQVFLQQILHVDRFCVGVANANRDDIRFERTVGLMVEILPMVFEPQENKTFVDLIRDTRTKILDGFEHATAPFHTALAPKNVSNMESHTPLFQVVVNYIAGVTQDIKFGESALKYSTSEEANHAQDLVVTIRDDPDGTTFISFTTQDYLYESKDIETLLYFFAELVEMLSLNPENCLKEYQFLQSAKMIENGQHLVSDFKNPWSQNISQRILATTENQPHITAVKDQLGMDLTYDGMEKRIQAIIAILTSAGIGPGMFVVVACGPSADSVCSLLAIWRIGAVYVPVDMDHGIDRMGLIVNDCQPSAILCKHPEKIMTLEMPDTVQVLTLESNLPEPKPTVSIDRSSENSTAILLYTSGTTGVPKGVLLTHDNMQSHIMAVQEYLNLGRETVLQQSSHGFDASIFQILNALAYGGTLIMTSGRSDPLELAELMVREKVSLTLAVPSEYALWIGEACQTLKECSSWRYAFSGGEKMTFATTHAFSQLALRDLDLINAYGPSEISIACSMGKISYRQIQSDAEKINIGKPLPSYNVSILDDSLKPVPQGWPGEICIGGPGVSSGYLNRDTETNLRFISDDGQPRLYRSGDLGRILPDGTIEYRGRIAGDSQIKLRGIRLELDEITNSIIRSSKGAISDAAVIAKGESSIFLVGFVVFSKDFPESDTESFLKALLMLLPLPTYAKPAILAPVDRIPLTGNGKVDRKALGNFHIPQSSVSETDEVLDVIETKLKELWEEILPVSGFPVGKQSNFFDLGGNSILILRLQARIRELTKVHIPVPKLFQATTLEEMAILTTLANNTQMEMKSVDWDAETAIPNALSQLGGPPSNKSIIPHEVVLTGATGFFGKCILKYLVEDPSIIKVHCIAVRPNQDGSLRKLSIQSSKIKVYSGDLSHPTLGLDEHDMGNLILTADAIIHNGAEVSFLKSYASLRAPNVSSTKFLLGIALAQRIPLHYISTAGVTSLSQQGSFSEASVASFQPPSAGAGNTEGYVASKWASEVFLEKASSELGVPVHIHRPSSIIGSDMSTNDVIGSLFELSRLMKVVPDLEGWKGYFDMISVDQAAKDVVNNVLKQDDKLSGDLSFSHVCGETRFKVCKIKEYMEGVEGVAFRELSLKGWVGRARHYGMDESVAAYLDNLDGSGKYFLPWLEKNGDVAC